MGSSRLPNKAMLHLHGYPVIEWVKTRLEKSKLSHKIIFAIPDGSKDESLATYLQLQRALVFRGSESDVLERFYQAARIFKATHVVRICADNPFVCPDEIDNLISYFLEHKPVYAYNHIPRENKYPDGLGGEMTSFATLEEIYHSARTPLQREHLFNYIWENQAEFKPATFDPRDQRLHKPYMSLDLDTPEDYEKMLRKKVSIEMKSIEILNAFEV
jgi:spore coat polysaccharide biosynthesis protein SpsF